jgi:plastocyanin
MFELQIPDEGLYPFVNHAFAYTGLGSVGLIKVDANAAPAPSSYPMMADPFSGGVTEATGGTGGASPTPTSTPAASPTSSGGGSVAACQPSGTQLTIMTMNSAFDTGCLAAPAGKPFTITLDNMDPGIPHNVSIYTDDSAATALFTGDLVTGPDTITYEVGALEPGTYFFRCDVHPTTMTGTFVVA